MENQPESSSQAQNPPQTQPTPTATVEGDLKKLHDALKPVIWSLYFEGSLINNAQTHGNLTAFGVKDNLLMTCAHGGWSTLRDLKITVKPICANNRYVARIVDRKANCDMVLLSVEGVERVQAGKFGDGKLEVGEGIMVYGHPHNLIASGCVGRNFYPCVTKPTNFDFNGTLICQNCPAPDPLSNPPRHRVMGDVWNADVFKKAIKDPKDTRNLDFERNLLARLPIIQAAGMVCGPGASGAPVFNFKREIVGMHVYGIHGYEIGIHVTALNIFLQNYLAKHPAGEGHAKEKGKTPLKKQRRH